MTGIFSSLASLLTYPDGDYPARIDACLRVAATSHSGICHPERGRTPESKDPYASDVVAGLEQFRAAIGDFSASQLQELFIQTFDLNPVCSLEIGWHLFGENYDRGLLLVRMRRELRRHGLVETSELPDHLSHALLLLDRMEREQAADFAAAVVLPALAKMLLAMKDKRNRFENVLLAAEQALRATYPELPAMAAPDQPPLRVLA